MKSQAHVCSPEAQAALLGELSADDDMSESVDELRAKLANMKRLMEERRGTTLGELSARKQRRSQAEMIDGNFLSWIFLVALGIILSVSFYAFYNLYHAVLKKFPSKHTEL
ncbi:uncharacterized protein LOC106658374 isoform X2 [Trichogramma pretiosum]|uniref:Uncharacterized protein n=1 Tax=Trichogramma kaykai TaxID=54128 RepID=A0ABD2WD14_9HYME|nr:uncharacterized protein LOC106658374 isoform X2 [Trichogramma pretiosum]